MNVHTDDVWFEVAFKHLPMNKCNANVKFLVHCSISFHRHLRTTEMGLCFSRMRGKESVSSGHLRSRYPGLSGVPGAHLGWLWNQIIKQDYHEEHRQNRFIKGLNSFNNTRLHSFQNFDHHCTLSLRPLKCLKCFQIIAL